MPAPSAAKRPKKLPKPKGKKIGLLGGSFNPAHEGHLHISLLALKLMGLNEIWWLVSPQNPLKSTEDMAPLNVRLQSAKEVAQHKSITPMALEDTLGTQYTIDTLRALKTHYPDTSFVWIMGADNLVQFSKWKDWEAIFSLVPIAVFDRAPASGKAAKSDAAMAFSESRLAPFEAKKLVLKKAPAWIYFSTPQNPTSATAIRNARTKNKKGALHDKR